MERNTASVRAADEQLDALLGHRGAATVSLLFALSDGAKRFGVLRSQMGRMSQKTGFAPRRTKEFTLETKVYVGTITSSPASMLQSSADMSSADVHEVVTSDAFAPVIFPIVSSQILRNAPSP